MRKIKRKSSGKLKISACYIVKDDAKNLKLSIKSLADYVDEIVVVDTGSSDDSVVVAKSFGARIFHEQWQNDFAAPRNVALEHARGDWIIFLDSDEYFSEETARNIRVVIDRAEQFHKNGLMIFRANIDVEDANNSLPPDYSLRIFKRLPKVHYFRKIHEEVRVGDKLLDEVTVVPPNILLLYHTGYSSSVSKDKAERNLKLLLEELAETDEPQRIYHYIADCYRGLDDFANAEKFAKLDIESGGTRRLFGTNSYRILLNILAQNPERIGDRTKYAARAVEEFPALPEFTAELAECFAAQDDYRKAVETMREALAKFKNYSGVEPTLFNAEVAKFAEQRIGIWTAEI